MSRFVDGEVGIDDDAVTLSPQALAALLEFARGKGVALGGPSTNEADNDGDGDGNDGSAERGGAAGRAPPNRSIDGEVDAISLVRAVQQHFDIKEKEQSFRITHGSVTFEVWGLKRELGQTLDSTGLTIWRAADRLCDYIYENQQLFRGKRICELGCGLGVVAILLHKLDLGNPLIVASDGDDKSVQLLTRNLHSTACDGDILKPVELLWGTEDADLAVFRAQFEEPFEVLVAADVIYDEAQIAPLSFTASRLLKRSDSARFYLAFARRNVPVGEFLQAIESHGLVWKKRAQCGEGEAIYEIKWANPLG